MILAIVNFIEELAEKDPHTYFVYVDGYRYPYFENLEKKYPERVIPAGICEANAVSIATGLALSGNTVYVFMIGAYAARKTLDQFSFAAYCNANIKIIGDISGTSVPFAGYSHTSIDDISILRNIPNLRIYNPCCQNEMEAVLKITYKNKYPAYITIDSRWRASNIQIKDIQLPKISKVTKGLSRDYCVLYCGYAGSFFYNYLQKELIKNGIDPDVYSIPVLKPFNDKEVENIITSHNKIICIDFHGIGSLVSSVSQIIAKKGLHKKFLPIFIDNDFDFTRMGQQDYVVSEYVNVKNCIEKILNLDYGLKSFLFSRKGIIRRDKNKIIIKYKIIGVQCLIKKRSLNV